MELYYKSWNFIIKVLVVRGTFYMFIHNSLQSIYLNESIQLKIICIGLQSTLFNLIKDYSLETVLDSEIFESFN